MGWSWEDPQWKREGRTGPGDSAPRYANRADRNAVRRGKPVGGPKKQGLLSKLIFGKKES